MGKRKRGVINAGAPLMLPRCDWSMRRWRIAGALEPVIHSHPGGRGKPRRDVGVVNTRLVPKNKGKVYPVKGRQEAARRLSQAWKRSVQETTKRLPGETDGHLKRRVRKLIKVRAGEQP